MRFSLKPKFLVKPKGYTAGILAYRKRDINGNKIVAVQWTKFPRTLGGISKKQHIPEKLFLRSDCIIQLMVWVIIKKWFFLALRKIWKALFLHKISMLFINKKGIEVLRKNWKFRLIKINGAKYPIYEIQSRKWFLAQWSIYIDWNIGGHKFKSKADAESTYEKLIEK